MTDDDVRKIFSRVGEMCDDLDGRPDYVLIPCELSFAMVNHINGSPEGWPDLSLLVDDQRKAQQKPVPEYNVASYALIGVIVFALHASMDSDEPFALPQALAESFIHIVLNPVVAYAAYEWFWGASL
jgi:hypothetical protein